MNNSNDVSGYGADDDELNFDSALRDGSQEEHVSPEISDCTARNRNTTHERSMHRHLANGSFSDKCFEVSMCDEIFDPPDPDKWKIKIPFGKCAWCGALYVQQLTKTFQKKKLYNIGSEEKKCCLKGKRLLRKEERMNADDFEAINPSLSNLYNHPELPKFACRLNTEYALTAPLIARGGSTGFVAFKGGLKHQRYNGSPISRVSNQATRHRVLQGLVYENDIKLSLEGKEEDEEFESNVYRVQALNFLQFLVMSNFFYKGFYDNKHLLSMKDDSDLQAPVYQLHFQTKEAMSDNCIALVEKVGEPCLHPYDLIIVPPTEHFSQVQDYPRPEILDIHHQYWEAVHYPVLNPFGYKSPNNIHRFNNGVQNENGARYIPVDADGNDQPEITLHEYVRCRLLQASILQRFGTLYERYCLMMFLRLDDINLQHHIAMNIKRKNENWKLFDSHLGSAAFQRKIAVNALTAAQRLGFPTIFITFTCNPNAPEILEHLREGEKITDRIDLVVKYFHAQNLLLRNIIESGHLFGRKPAYILQVIEFQQRGLPHSHTVVCFGGRQFTKEEIDDYVTASYPVDSTPEERELMRKHMTHSCRKKCKKPDCSCKYGYPKPENFSTYIDKLTGKPIYRRVNNFPNEKNLNWRNLVPTNLKLLKLLNSHVNVEWCGNQNCIAYLFSYAFKGPDYLKVCAQRVKGAKINEISEYQLVRSIASTEAMWRILNYPINYMSVSVTEIKAITEEEDAKNDGVSDIMRYFLRPLDEFFNNMRLLKFHESYMTSKTLPKYLHGSDKFYMNQEIPAQFVYRREKGPLHVFRLKFYTPMKQGERYYLRKLLMEISARSYGDLKTWKDPDTDIVETFETYQQACMARNLIPESDVCFDALKEMCALGFQPSRARNAFVIFVCYSGNDEFQISFPDLLQKKLVMLDNEEVTVLGYMAYDFLMKLCVLHGNLVSMDILRAHAAEYAMRDIHARFKKLEAQEFSFFGLQEYEPVFTNSLYSLEKPGQMGHVQLQHRNVLQRERSSSHYNFSKMRRNVQSCIGDLTLEQKSALDEILNSTKKEPHDKNVFIIDASAGTGKTHLLTVLTHIIRSDSNFLGDPIDTSEESGKYRNGVVICCASTGLASLLYEGGTTAHNVFGIPISNDYDQILESTIKDPFKLEMLSKARLIVWDEAMSSHIAGIFCASNLMRKVVEGGKDFAFGGVTTVFCGDARQIPPIIPFVSGLSSVQRTSIIGNNSIRNNATFLKLTLQMRALLDKPFGDFVKAIGEGNIGEPSNEAYTKIITQSDFRNAGIEIDYTRNIIKENSLQTHQSLEIPNGEGCKTVHVFSEEERMFVDKVFPDLSVNVGGCAILATTNERTKYWNALTLKKLHGRERCYYSSNTIRKLDTLTDPDSNRGDVYKAMLTEDYLETINRSGLAAHKLILKIGCLVLIIRNLNPEEMIMNGTKAIVRALFKHNIECERIDHEGNPTGKMFIVNRISFTFTVGVPPLQIEVIRKQFPLVLAYSLTLNKSQGQTLIRAGIDSRDDAFSHGQMFVCLSRCKNRNAIKFFGETEELILKNVVMKELLD